MTFALLPSWENGGARGKEEGRGHGKRAGNDGKKVREEEEGVGLQRLVEETMGQKVTERQSKRVNTEGNSENRKEGKWKQRQSEMKMSVQTFMSNRSQSLWHDTLDGGEIM